jgi:hypothetical protein
MRAMRTVALLSLLLVASVAAAAGQTLRGTLTDETTGSPVAGATILLVDPAGRHQGATTTDQAGAFTLQAPSPGATYAVRARKEGFATVDTRPFRVTANTAPLTLKTRPEIPVLGEVSAPALNYAGFLERRNARLGVALGPDEVRRRIDRVGALDPSRLVWGLLPGLTENKTTQATVVPRRAGGPGCVATLVIDGKRYDPTFKNGRPRVPPWDIDRLVSISEIRAVEIYHDPSFVPVEKAREWLDPIIRRCGVIVLWTYRGIGVD